MDDQPVDDQPVDDEPLDDGPLAGELRAGAAGSGERADDGQAETYNPWSIVNLVFGHLAEQGLHPVLGNGRDPGEPARALLSALGIQPSADGNLEVRRRVHAHLAEIRTVVFDAD